MAESVPLAAAFRRVPLLTPPPPPLRLLLDEKCVTEKLPFVLLAPPAITAAVEAELAALSTVTVVTELLV